METTLRNTKGQTAWRKIEVANNLKVVVTVNLVPHPNPKAAIDLIAEIVIKKLGCREGGDLSQVGRKAG